MELIQILDGCIKLILKKEDMFIFFVKGWEYKTFDFNINLPGTAFDFKIPGFTNDLHLFGVKEEEYTYLELTNQEKISLVER